MELNGVLLCFPVFVLKLKTSLNKFLGWNVFLEVISPYPSSKINQKPKNNSLFMNFFITPVFSHWNLFHIQDL